MIFIDWKAPGRDYLDRFATAYPTLGFLTSDQYNQLVDELANESPEQCFERLGPFLAEHRYELWNVDSGGDDYQLVLVPSGATEQARAEWGDDAAPTWAPTEPQLERGSAKTSTRSKKLPTIVADSDYHLGYGGLGFGNSIVAFTDWETDDGTVRGLLDLQSFPLDVIDANGFLELADSSRSLYPLSGYGEIQYWQYETKKTRQVVVFTDYQAGTFVEVPGIAFGSTTFADAFASTVFFATHTTGVSSSSPALVVARPPNHEEPAWADEASPTERAALTVIRNGEHRAVGTLDGRGTLIALSEHEAAYVFGDNHIDESNRRAVVVIDIDANAVVSTHMLPCNGGNFFRLNDTEIAYVHGTVSPHPENGEFEQREPFLVRFNLRTGDSRQASIDGMCDNYTFKTRKYTNYPAFENVSYTFHTFDGGIHASSGHGDWMILNYLTAAYGSHDLSWLWNTATDEVVRIAMSDFPRCNPRLHYIPKLGRYIADDSCRTDLLVAFDEIYQTRPRTQLLWTDVITP